MSSAQSGNVGGFRPLFSGGAAEGSGGGGGYTLCMQENTNAVALQ